MAAEKYERSVVVVLAVEEYERCASKLSPNKIDKKRGPQRGSDMRMNTSAIVATRAA